MSGELAPVPGGRRAADKITKFGWRVRDEPGVLLMIPKEQLRIDHSYQRDYQEQRATKMAANWSWIACGTLTVAERDGQFYVVAGQHRLAAAMKRSDIREMPCIVFESEGIAQEAEGFVAESTSKRAIDWVDRIRAMSIYGDQIAIRIVALCEEAGRQISRNSAPNNVACISSIYAEMSSNAERAEGVFRLMCAMCEGAIFDNRLFAALCYVDQLIDGDLSVYKPGKLRDRLLRVGSTILLDEIQRASVFYRRGGSKVWGHAVVDALNRGVRVNRISLRSASPGAPEVNAKQSARLSDRNTNGARP